MNQNGRDQEVAPTNAGDGRDQEVAPTNAGDGRDQEVAPTAGFHFGKFDH